MIRFDKFIINSGVHKFLYYISVFTIIIYQGLVNLEINLKNIIAL